ncbi:phytanoyl-CoA dioxygenase family protein [Novosphingobium taihuense]|uniref:Ectoine hydroxylase-related dioxygenase (Phytanoyl-CoA dioxygenase family) n=1 Tax=Novosphingobium taihuense TaxID=260085 RepID=A0A7W7EVF6_9SPHN|nr:phytanoyl-CoA dioxygenase family protein [Novosphingobium taihuense]MBB4615019.1 ectoine hydroxylase-related dioxygenase (phytanoyl-CoA dioxygenase family) [Novosphingobium taihuense]TWH84540.1 phytanoyl-CoA dioxygenase PhyH [Novosphingobium taihuense]
MTTSSGNCIKSSFADTPSMPEFNTSNHLLGDRSALDAAWERDGYWFFRDVLDKDAIADVRAVFMDVLNELGVVEPGRSDVAIYNGAPLDDYPIKMGGDPELDPLLARYPSKSFISNPKIKAFFEELLGDEVVWVPNTEFHAVPPSGSSQASRFNYVHADGANNKGLKLRVAWIPIAPIDEATGGLAVTEGLHRPRMGDFPRPPQGIKLSDVPQDSWRRAEYQPGDLLMFALESPHSGLANRSESFFRMSMDIRCTRKSDGVPLLGTLAEVDRNAIAIDDDEGQRHVFRLDEDTFFRIYRGRETGMPVPLSQIPELARIGSRVFVAHDHGTAIFVRPQH